MNERAPESPHTALARRVERWLRLQDELLVQLPLRYHVAPLHAISEALGVDCESLRRRPNRFLLKWVALLSPRALCEEHAELRAQLSAQLDREDRESLRRSRRARLMPWRLIGSSRGSFEVRPLRDPESEPLRVRALLDPNTEPWPGDGFLGWVFSDHALGIVGCALTDAARAAIDALEHRDADEGLVEALLVEVLDPERQLRLADDLEDEAARSREPPPPLASIEPLGGVVEAVTERLDFDVVYSRWASPNHKVFKRRRRARQMIAAARDEDDMLTLRDAIRRLRFELLPALELDRHDIRTPSHPALEPLVPVAAVLAPLGVSPSGESAAASVELLARHPLALLGLVADHPCVIELGALAPIAAARRWANEIAAGHVEAQEIEAAFSFYESEQRWLATFGDALRERGDAGGLREIDYEATREALELLFDPRAQETPLGALGLDGALTRRLQGALGGDSASVAALPMGTEALEAIKGVGPRSVRGLAKGMLEWTARWRVERAGLIMEQVFRGLRGAESGAESLEEGLRELAGFFDVEGLS